MAIGNKIKSLLKKKHMKVTTLANLANIPEQTLYAIIRRDSTNVDLDILRKICAATEINISYFYSKHSNVRPEFNSTYASDYIAFSVIDLPNKKPNEKHYDIATNNIVLSILESMAEEQDCSPSDVLENILTEYLKNYANDSEMTVVVEDDAEEGANMDIADASSDDNADTNTSTRDTDLPYWMF